MKCYIYVYFFIIADIVLNLIAIRFIVVNKIIDSLFKPRISPNIEGCTIEKSSILNVEIYIKKIKTKFTSKNKDKKIESKLKFIDLK